MVQFEPYIFLSNHMANRSLQFEDFTNQIKPYNYKIYICELVQCGEIWAIFVMCHFFRAFMKYT